MRLYTLSSRHAPRGRIALLPSLPNNKKCMHQLLSFRINQIHTCLRAVEQLGCNSSKTARGDRPKVYITSSRPGRRQRTNVRPGARGRKVRSSAAMPLPPLPACTSRVAGETISCNGSLQCGRRMRWHDVPSPLDPAEIARLVDAAPPAGARMSTRRSTCTSTCHVSSGTVQAASGKSHTMKPHAEGMVAPSELQRSKSVPRSTTTSTCGALAMAAVQCAAVAGSGICSVSVSPSGRQKCSVLWTTGGCCTTCLA